MSETITATEAARRFSDLLNRVRYRDETFVILRNGEEVGRLLPPKKDKRITLKEFMRLLERLEWPDPDFGKDLERIRAEQPPMPPDPWDS